MTLHEFLAELVKVYNHKTKDYKVVINGTNNWEYPVCFTAEPNEVVLQTTDTNEDKNDRTNKE